MTLYDILWACIAAALILGGLVALALAALPNTRRADLDDETEEG